MLCIANKKTVVLAGHPAATPVQMRIEIAAPALFVWLGSDYSGNAHMWLYKENGSRAALAAKRI